MKTLKILFIVAMSLIEIASQRIYTILQNGKKTSMLVTETTTDLYKLNFQIKKAQLWRLKCNLSLLQIMLQQDKYHLIKIKSNKNTYSRDYVYLWKPEKNSTETPKFIKN